MGTGQLVLVALAVIAAIFAFIIVVIVGSFINTWIQARFSGAPITFINLLSMKLRRVPISLIVQSRITAVKAGIPLTTDQLEAHYLAGGDVNQVVRALIAAEKATLNLGFNQAAAIDLATHQSGKSVFEAVMTSVNPKVIDCPNPASGKQLITGVAKDGIELRVKARVTVRTHLDRFVGGATEETIIARVGEGIVTAIGSAQSYKDVLENPDMISKTVLAKGLDASTAFGIMSIDIADVDVGDNIGARLQTEQADANKQIAQAAAETRRTLAVASEQEMKARTQEMRAKVVEAEAQIPMAMAEAFRAGHLGIMDYYRMQNVQADSKMRQSIAGEDPGKSGGAAN
ncbi:MAG: flotillin-like protein FloA [Verrucomicrobiota bacterium]|jgi:uncharacterized protein YqfA (UPF0365 family)